MANSVSLTPFSHVVLVLVGEGGAGPHDLVRMARQGKIYWATADSQWYAEPKRLAAAGLPAGFHLAAADIYRRLDGFKDAAKPPLSEVKAALLRGN